jgi:hypothetical protein
MPLVEPVTSAVFPFNMDDSPRLFLAMRAASFAGAGSTCEKRARSQH